MAALDDAVRGAFARPASLRVELRPHRGFAVFLAAAHGMTGVLALLAPLPQPVHLVVPVLLAVSATHAIRRHALRSHARAVTALEFSDRRHCRAKLAGEAWVAATVEGSSTVSLWLTVINLRTAQGALCHAVIVPGVVEPDAFRRLRVWLRFGPEISAPPAA